MIFAQLAQAETLSPTSAVSAAAAGRIQRGVDRICELRRQGLSEEAIRRDSILVQFIWEGIPDAQRLAETTQAFTKANTLCPVGGTRMVVATTFVPLTPAPGSVAPFPEGFVPDQEQPPPPAVEEEKNHTVRNVLIGVGVVGVLAIGAFVLLRK
jgi:hypothetical protein